MAGILAGFLWISCREVARIPRSIFAHDDLIVVVIGAIAVMAVLLAVARLVAFLPMHFFRMLLFLGSAMLLVLVPVGVMFLDPVGMMIVPPLASTPFVMVVEVAIILPIRMILGPFRMVGVHPAGIVLMPPGGLVPLMTFVVIAPTAGTRQFCPDVGMLVHPVLERGMLVAE